MCVSLEVWWQDLDLRALFLDRQILWVIFVPLFFYLFFPIYWYAICPFLWERYPSLLTTSSANNQERNLTCMLEKNLVGIQYSFLKHHISHSVCCKVENENMLVLPNKWKVSPVDSWYYYAKLSLVFFTRSSIKKVNWCVHQLQPCKIQRF